MPRNYVPKFVSDRSPSVAVIEPSLPLGAAYPAGHEQYEIGLEGGTPRVGRIAQSRKPVAGRRMSPYVPKPLSAGVGAEIHLFLEDARNGRLVVCAGAGLSIAEDSMLPSGAGLAEMLNVRLTGRLSGYVTPSNTENLLAVADAAEAATETLERLQSEVAELAPFQHAPPNYGHACLALLVAEGALATVMVWNWDNCVERSSPDRERIEVALSLEDMSRLRIPAVAKVHGCATRPETMLVTSRQLSDQQPLWADPALEAALKGSKVIFIGIGDVADYARARLMQLNEELESLEVFLVSPSVVDGWDNSVWAEILPDLDQERRYQMSADEFLDGLVCLWASEITIALQEKLNGLQTDTRTQAESILASWKTQDGVAAITWARRAALKKGTGESAVRATETVSALVAGAVLAAESGRSCYVATDARLTFEDQTAVEVMTLRGLQPSQVVEREARRRAAQLASRGQIGDTATFLVAGDLLGGLDGDELDLASAGEGPDDLISGPDRVSISFEVASNALQRA